MAQIYTHTFVQNARAAARRRKEQQAKKDEIIQAQRSVIATSERLVQQLRYELAKLVQKNYAADDVAL